MAYGSVLTDTVQSSTAATAPVFKDGNGTQIGTLCRTWVNFAGASGTINGSFNVSSVTRNSTGNYTVNFTTAMPNANYNVVLGVNSATDASFIKLGTSGGAATLGTSSFTLITTNFVAASADPSAAYVSVFR